MRIILIAILLASLSIAAQSSVVFYCSFDGTVTPATAKDPSFEVKEGQPTFEPGKRAQALLAGDGKAYLEYKALNIPAKEGSMEFWFKPLDWNGLDTDTFHVFVETDTDKAGNWFLVYKYFGAQNAGFIWEADGSIFQRKMGGWQGWVHMLVTWSPRGCRMYFNGQPSSVMLPKDPPAEYTGRMIVGDRAWQIKRVNEHTLLDELYIYDRALEPEEAAWALANADARVQGSDIPRGLVPTKVHAKILPSKGTITAQVRPRDQNYLKSLRGFAELLGPTPLPKRPLRASTDQAVTTFTFKKLQPGDYALRAWFEDDKGKVVDEAVDKFTCPKNDWLGNKIGISAKPPKPFTPVKADAAGFSCWGRKYRLDSTGLPKSISSLGAELLSGPVQLEAYSAGKRIAWKPSGLTLKKSSAVDALYTGKWSGSVGTLDWSALAEYDGMVKYTLTLKPAAGASLDKLELRFPINPDQAKLMNCQLSNGMKVGALPEGDGAVVKAPGFTYWWLGNEDRGLLAFCESDEAWDRLDRPDGFRIERNGGNIDVVLSFIDGKTTLTKPWSFTFGFSATPVRDVTGLRGKPSRVLPMNEWLLPGKRDYTPEGLAGQIENEGVRPDNQGRFLVFWDGGEWRTYNPTYGKPEVYKEGIAKLKAKGLSPITYMMPREITESVPEWRFWSDEWSAGRKNAWTDENWDGTTCSRSWSDFLLAFRMKNVEQYGLSGYYTDNAEPPNARNLDGGCGYMRDGKLIGTNPWFGLRDFYKRLYTALKEREAKTGDPTMIMAHVSTSWPIAYMGFMDNRLDGEQFSYPIRNLHKSYTDLIPLDAWRAEYLSANVGNMSVFLPEFGEEDIKTPAKTREILGLMALHDMIGAWGAANGQFKADPLYKLWQIQDDFGIEKADLLPYWNNSKLIEGQTDTLKVTAYHRKDTNTTLLVIANLGTEEQTARLTVQWNKLCDAAKLSITDAETGETLPATGAGLSVAVKGRDYRVVRVE